MTARQGRRLGGTSCARSLGAQDIPERPPPNAKLAVSEAPGCFIYEDPVLDGRPGVQVGTHDLRRFALPAGGRDPQEGFE